MTTSTRLSASTGTETLTWHLASRDRTAGEAAATALLSAGVEGILGHASPEEWQRIANVLRSMSGFIQDADIEDAPAGEPRLPLSLTPRFVPDPGCTAADSNRLATDALWGHAEEAVFLFRRGDTLGAKSSLGRALQEIQMGQAAAFAAHLLLSYFVQRVLGLASEAGRTRQRLGKACLHEETS